MGVLLLVAEERRIIPQGTVVSEASSRSVPQASYRFLTIFQASCTGGSPLTLLPPSCRQAQGFHDPATNEDNFDIPLAFRPDQSTYALSKLPFSVRTVNLNVRCEAARSCTIRIHHYYSCALLLLLPCCCGLFCAMLPCAPMMHRRPHATFPSPLPAALRRQDHQHPLDASAAFPDHRMVLELLQRRFIRRRLVHRERNGQSGGARVPDQLRARHLRGDGGEQRPHTPPAACSPRYPWLLPAAARLARSLGDFSIATSLQSKR